MPKSMNACVRELREAQEVKDQSFEGHLSQQGGDCPVRTIGNFTMDVGFANICSSIGDAASSVWTARN
jgi:hypothetical protein